MVLVQCLIKPVTVNSVSRAQATLYHNFNGRRCRVKFISHSLIFNQTTKVDAVLFRVDSDILKPLPGFGIPGLLIPLYPNDMGVINGEGYAFDVLMVGGTINFDVVYASEPVGTATPYGVNSLTFIQGHLAFDITPID
jgi:hypothetical protein